MTISRLLAIVLTLALVVSSVFLSVPQSQVSKTAFAPDRWPKEELDRYMSFQNPRSFLTQEGRASATGRNGMIVGTSEPLAIHAGLEVLKQGGNAADASLTTSLAQIALSAGAAYSYAGILTAVYYDARSGKVYALNAAYNTVKGETDPNSIPSFGSHSGRTALVPGFMAGVQALHDRFGKLQFSSLFDPAIWIAENGVPFSPLVEAWLKQAGPFVTRLPEARRVFTKENGEFYKSGELFRQPELAETLRKTASGGSAYIYKGDWARHFVDAVRREGGKMTMEDLAAYEPLWSEPAEVTYDGYQILATPVPNLGGRLIQWSLGLAGAADLKQYPHYTKSSQSLHYLIEISRRGQELAYSPLPVTRENIASQWSRILAGTKTVPETADTTPHHSAGVIAVDAEGNVACLLHSINTQLWGSTGIFVDGISIPDSATFQQQQIARAGPGQRLPETTNPLIVLRDGKPVLAAMAIGSGLHQSMLQNLVNILDFGMDPKTSADTPNTQGPYLGSSVTGPAKPEYSLEAVAEGDFPESLLNGVSARGRAIKVLPKTDRSQLGYWIGVQIDPKTRKMQGAASSILPSLVEGF